MLKYVIFLALILFSFAAFSQVDLSVSVTNSLTFKPVEDVMVSLENKEIGFKETLQSNSADRKSVV